MTAVFVTGTDTDCGKTLVTLAIMQSLQSRAFRVNGYKPVAAGMNVGQHNNDALLIQRQSSTQLPYNQVNPYLFAPAIAPHIAAAKINETINAQRIASGLQQVCSTADVTVVEGAGGWLVPLNDNLDIADIALNSQLPVILVVGLKLGCLNHARLAADSIRAKGARLIGWIGSQVDRQMTNVEENVQALKHYMACDCLGIIPFLEKTHQPEAAAFVNADRLMQLLGLD